MRTASATRRRCWGARTIWPATTTRKPTWKTGRVNLNPASGATTPRPATTKERGCLGRRIRSCATSSLTESATATATCWTRLAHAAAIAQRTQTATECATTWTRASACWTPVACATAPGQCTSADATKCQKETAIATATKSTRSGCAVATARSMRTATDGATSASTRPSKATPSKPRSSSSTSKAA